MKKLLGIMLGLLLVVSVTPAIGYYYYYYNMYGAIAYDTATGAYGYTYNYGNRASAESAALSRCGRPGCEVRTWFYNACGALSTSNDGGWGSSRGSSRYNAEVKALNACRQINPGKNCSIRCWACTDR